jgi:FkbM family methyltransferase
LAEILSVKHGELFYKYVVVNNYTEGRVRSMFTKEPDTIKWIKGMAKGDVFIDIGANVGIYTIFAAVRGLKVYAFEPEAQNYALLTQNIFVNEQNAKAYCLALSDKQELSGLYLSTFNPGGSCHTFGESLDHHLKPRTEGLIQGCVSMRLDDLGINADHIKIDVDGFEHKVIRGGEKTIRTAQSVLIEINTKLPEHMNLVTMMQDWGFSYDPAQVEEAKRKAGAFEGVGNWIFHNEPRKSLR